jgi:hypothetical protein
MSKEKEIRLFQLNFKPEIREKDGNKFLVGYAVKYNELSRRIGWGFKEKFLPGAFDEALAGDFNSDLSYDTIALFNHDKNKILGRRSSGTLILESDNIGLRYEINIPDTTTGNDLLVSIERGDVRHSSFAFAVASDGVSWEEDKNEGDVRVVKEVKYLFDVSPVGDPAYAQSTVEVAQRSHEEWLKSKNENKPVSRTWETDRMKREIEMYN